MCNDNNNMDKAKSKKPAKSAESELEEPEPTFKYDAHVHEIFSSNFTVTKDHMHGSYQIIHDGIVCLNFKLIEHSDKPTVLYVSKLFKCGGDERTGPALLNLIDKLAESIPRVKYIELQDGSSISICDEEISLRNLKILTNGESWYNSFGYKSDHHEEDKHYNEQIRTRTMDELLPELLETSDIITLKENANALFPGLSTTWTAKDYIAAMLKAVPKTGTTKPVIRCTEEQQNKAELLIELVWRLGKLLQYDFILQKKVERDPSFGGNKRSGRNQRSKRNKSKKRSRRTKPN